MSYCRFSSDNYRCDLYVYQDCDSQYIIHIASQRYKGRVPKISLDDIYNPKKFLKQYRKRDDYLQEHGTEPIGLEMAGETITCGTAEEVLHWLRRLQKIGYRFPKTVIETLEEELHETKSSES